MIERAFKKIGARVKRRVNNPRVSRVVMALGRQRRIRKFSRPTMAKDGIKVDIGFDRNGEYFDILTGSGTEPEVVDIRPDLRHLVLMVRKEDGRKDKFLCGHDERHWFVAALPNEGVKSVADAMKALRPSSAAEDGVKRQGEWFFVPCPNLDIPDSEIHRNEPIRRGRSKPHICEEIYRTGGQLTYIKGGSLHTAAEFKARTEGKDNWRERSGWTSMIRDARVYARGRVRHKDHYTLCLDGWHEVLMNREDKAPHGEAVVFLD